MSGVAHHEPPGKRRRVPAGHLVLPRAPATDRRMAVVALASAGRPSAAAPDRCVGDSRRGSDTYQLQASCREAIAAAMEPVEIKKGGESEVGTDGPPSETTEAQEEDEDDWL